MAGLVHEQLVVHKHKFELSSVHGILGAQVGQQAAQRCLPVQATFLILFCHQAVPPLGVLSAFMLVFIFALFLLSLVDAMSFSTLAVFSGDVGTYGVRWSMHLCLCILVPCAAFAAPFMI